MSDKSPIEQSPQPTSIERKGEIFDLLQKLVDGLDRDKVEALSQMCQTRLNRPSSEIPTPIPERSSQIGSPEHPVEPNLEIIKKEIISALNEMNVPEPQKSEAIKNLDKLGKDDPKISIFNIPIELASKLEQNLKSKEIFGLDVKMENHTIGDSSLDLPEHTSVFLKVLFPKNERPTPPIQPTVLPSPAGIDMPVQKINLDKLRKMDQTPSSPSQGMT